MELNKDSFDFIEEGKELLLNVISIRYWFNFDIDLYYSFELMASYNRDVTQFNNLVKNESYRISKKLAKQIKKADLYNYIQEKTTYSNIIKSIEENVEFDYFYKETLGEFYMILFSVGIEMEDINLYVKDCKEIENKSNLYGHQYTKEMQNLIKKKHPLIYISLKILAYLDYLNFLKKIEKTPKIVEKELHHKFINSSVNFNSKAENLSYKWIGKTTDLDRIYKNLKPFLHSDTKSINDFRAIFKGAKLEHTKPIKLNFVASELIYFIETLMNEEYIKKESSWNWNRINVLFKNFNGSEFPKSMKTIKSQLDANLTPASKEKIDNIFK